jgi:chromosome segregation ATPase
MKRRSKIAVTAGIVLLVVSLSLNIVSAVNQTAVPGSEQDPIVSKSYVDAAYKELSTKIQMLIEQNDVLKSQNAQLSADLTKQEQTIKTLQSEIAALKSGAAQTSPNQPAGTGNSGPAKTEDTKQPAATSKGVVNTAVLNLRAEPNTSSTILGKLLKNDTVTIISKTSNGWYKITTSKGKTGYVLGTLITVK